MQEQTQEPKRGRGRPKKLQQERLSNLLWISVSDEMREKVRKAAKRYQLNLTTWMRMAIVEKLEREGVE